MHNLRDLPEHVLVRTEQSVWYLHTVHDDYGAIDPMTHAVNSSLLVDLRAEMKRRGMTVPGEEATVRTEPELVDTDDDTDNDDTEDQDRLFTPGEVCTIFGVGYSTVRRYERAGRLKAVRTSGGHRRYPESEVEALRASIDPRP